MKRIRFTEEQVIAVLRGAGGWCEDGRSGAPTLYNWKAKYDGLERR